MEQRIGGARTRQRGLYGGRRNRIRNLQGTSMWSERVERQGEESQENNDKKRGIRQGNRWNMNGFCVFSECVRNKKACTAGQQWGVYRARKHVENGCNGAEDMW